MAMPWVNRMALWAPSWLLQTFAQGFFWHDECLMILAPIAEVWPISWILALPTIDHIVNHGALMSIALCLASSTQFASTTTMFFQWMSKIVPCPSVLRLYSWSSNKTGGLQNSMFDWWHRHGCVAPLAQPRHLAAAQGKAFPSFHSNVTSPGDIEGVVTCNISWLTVSSELS